jgi:hypothetical protein
VALDALVSVWEADERFRPSVLQTLATALDLIGHAGAYRRGGTHLRCPQRASSAPPPRRLLTSSVRRLLVFVFECGGRRLAVRPMVAVAGGLEVRVGG